MNELNMELPEELKATLVQNMMATFWMSTVAGFVKHVGSNESMEIMGSAMERIGVAKAESMLKVIPPLEPNALGFGAWTNTWEDLMGIEGRITESSPERVVKIITKCPMAQEPGASQSMCDLFGHCLKGSISVIAPGFRWYQTHGFLKGDDHCRWVIERIKE